MRKKRSWPNRQATNQITPSSQRKLRVAKSDFKNVEPTGRGSASIPGTQWLVLNRVHVCIKPIQHKY